MKLFMVLIFGILLNLPGYSVGQSFSDDQKLISRELDHRSKQQSRPADQERFSPVGRNLVERYNPISLSLSASLYAYRQFISPQLGSNCIYHTSCSTFGKESINIHGFTKGVILTADRISRCNRIAGSDAAFHRIDQDRGQIRDEPTRY